MKWSSSPIKDLSKIFHLISRSVLHVLHRMQLQVYCLFDMCFTMLPYSGKLLREKIFMNFAVHLRRFSPLNLGVPYLPMIGFSIPRKFSLRNGPTLLICESFPLYAYGIIRMPTKEAHICKEIARFLSP